MIPPPPPTASTPPPMSVKNTQLGIESSSMSAPIPVLFRTMGYLPPRMTRGLKSSFDLAGFRNNARISRGNRVRLLQRGFIPGISVNSLPMPKGR